jgi:hypothetical protein
VDPGAVFRFYPPRPYSANVIAYLAHLLLDVTAFGELDLALVAVREFGEELHSAGV